ncbi:hypothetical protein GLOIN_2v1775128 [Rhizophagus irregularis DAOM 181602=DAOM 197198]|nr:hypothetical protein GLOIN_2v1775128 [Rhizophagus irregularis DAOM 181602=DAOM 197198]
MTARIFYQDYPNNPYINAQYIAGGKIFRSKYKIIVLGHYPQNVKYTQKIELNQQPILDDDEEHQDNPIGIMVDEQEIGNGVYRSIRNLLQIFIPIWSRSNPPILQPGNTINLKLDGDGRNVGRKQNHVLINTMCLLNKKEEVQRKIQTLAKVVKYQLQDLQENGISVNDVHWSIDLVTGSLCTI